MAITDDFQILPGVSSALRTHEPIVALESTVITHGLPEGQNLVLARELEEIINAEKVVPATIALIDGKINVGLSDSDLETLVKTKDPLKISRRNIGLAVAMGKTGGTTVAGTMFIANQCGIKVFSTGGIGGVHRDSPFDISADLLELSHTPMIVVCSGAKAILDLPATREYLETMSVPLIGYQTDELPGFYSERTGLPVDATIQSPSEIVNLARKHWQLGMTSAILVVVPPPDKYAIPSKDIEIYIREAQKDASKQRISGSALTPFLLRRISELSNGKSLRINLELLKNNARIASKIASCFHPRIKEKIV